MVTASIITIFSIKFAFLDINRRLALCKKDDSARHFNKYENLEKRSSRLVT